MVLPSKRHAKHIRRRRKSQQPSRDASSAKLNRAKSALHLSVVPTVSRLWRSCQLVAPSSCAWSAMGSQSWWRDRKYYYPWSPDIFFSSVCVRNNKTAQSSPSAANALRNSLDVHVCGVCVCTHLYDAHPSIQQPYQVLRMMW